ncbi:MAG: DUF4435 domain-containing protein [Chloroflexi bacterium]|nr:DUF4435 domain-containing protein [Chloroflexota bacterium]
MAVTAASVGLIFCEGKDDSYDSRLLDRLLESSGPRIVPIGGKFGFNAYIDGYLSSYSQKPPFIAFRDRDFDLKPSAQPSLIRIPGSKPIWATYRACVESYLIDTELIRDFWREKANGPKWEFGLPPEAPAIEQALVNSAQQIAAYQAVRWALAGLKPGNRWPEIKTTWLKSSGELPTSFAFDDCLSSARELVQTFLSEVGTVSIKKLEQTANQHLAVFSDSSFYENSLYLIWFHGKDLLRAFCENLSIQPLCKLYVTWAIDHFDINAHADLLALKDRCGKL